MKASHKKVFEFLLENGPATSYRAAEFFNMSEHTANQYMRELRERKKIYVSGFEERENSRPRFMYSVGNEPDLIFSEIKEKRRIEKIAQKKIELEKNLEARQIFVEQQKIEQEKQEAKQRASEYVHAALRMKNTPFGWLLERNHV